MLSLPSNHKLSPDSAATKDAGTPRKEEEESARLMMMTPLPLACQSSQLTAPSRPQPSQPSFPIGLGVNVPMPNDSSSSLFLPCFFDDDDDEDKRDDSPSVRLAPRLPSRRISHVY
uniref:Uncharacterized protein n=1 Tax=Amphora coffeiformis TaxID=265554 RepID=A0A7S3L3T3_9STRA